MFTSRPLASIGGPVSIAALSPSELVEDSVCAASTRPPSRFGSVPSAQPARHDTNNETMVARRSFIEAPIVTDCGAGNVRARSVAVDARN